METVSKLVLSAWIVIIGLYLQLLRDFHHLPTVGCTSANLWLVSPPRALSAVFEDDQLTTVRLHQSTPDQHPASTNHVTLVLKDFRRFPPKLSLKPNILLKQATKNSSNRKYSVLTSFHCLWMVIFRSNLAVILRFVHFTCLLQVSYFVSEFDSARWIDAFKHTSFLIAIFAFSWKDFHSDSKTGHFCGLIAITVFV